jgi:sensor histidine kinase YesM
MSNVGRQDGVSGKVIATVVGLFGVLMAAVITLAAMVPSKKDQQKWDKAIEYVGSLSASQAALKAEKDAQFNEIMRGIERLDKNIEKLQRSVEHRARNN